MMNRLTKDRLPKDDAAQHTPKSESASANAAQNGNSRHDNEPHHWAAPGEDYPSYTYPYMPPPYPAWYDEISLDMSIGVAIGGVVGMVLGWLLPTAIGETILIFACMGVGTVIGAAIGIVRYFLKTSPDTS